MGRIRDPRSGGVASEAEGDHAEVGRASRPPRWRTPRATASPNSCSDCWPRETA